MSLTNDDLQAIAALLAPIEQHIKAIEWRTESIEQSVASIDHRVASVELTLENETNRNIRLIAEGHLDISRKLDDALKVENEREMLLIRVNHLENELRKVKERLEEIA